MRIKIGSKVRCKLWNAPEQKFYSESWIGEVLEINEGSISFWKSRYSDKNTKVYTVTKPYHLDGIVLQRKEIRRVLTAGK